MDGRVGGGVAPLVARPVGEGDVADAHLRAVVERAGHGQGPAVLQAEEDGDLAAPGGLLEVVGRGDLDELARDQGLGRDPVELLGVLPAALGVQGGGHVEGEDDPVHPALSQARQVDVAVGQALGEVGRGLPEPGGDVGVAVDDEGFVVEVHGGDSVAPPPISETAARA